MSFPKWISSCPQNGGAFPKKGRNPLKIDLPGIICAL